MPVDLPVAAEEIKQFARAALLKIGLSPDDADTAADAMLWADLRGIDAHGMARLRWMLELAQSGELNPRPTIQTIRQTPATMLIDADRAPGMVAATFAMNQAVQKARQAGIGWVVVRNMTSPLAIGYYTAKAARDNVAAIAIVCGQPNMAPHGAKAPGVHASPISIAVPAASHPPLLLDMSTSVITRAQITHALADKKAIPKTWALDRHGVPTTDPAAAAIVLPLGGPKGSGMAMLFECLTSILAANPLLESFDSTDPQTPRHQQNGLFAAIDLAAFGDVDEYKRHVDRLIETQKSLTRSADVEEIFVPGEQADRTAAHRLQHGVPLCAEAVQSLRHVATRLNLPLPRNL